MAASEPLLTAPLCQRELDDWIAEVQTPLPVLAHRRQIWRCAEFLGQVERLAQRLPAAQYVINLCENRYLFMLAFCAALVRRQTTLLPQNRALGTQQSLVDEYPDTYIVHDGPLPLAPAPSVDLNQFCLLGEESRRVPEIPLDFTAALAFTSGSTGRPKPNCKTWRTFVVSSRINANYMLPPEGALLHAVATVPPQHMWGMETSVLLPLFARVCIADIRPFFPQDIAQALGSLPEPRLLISTPVHLRALTQAGISWPPTSRVLCATAPLAQSLAEEVEQQAAAVLTEVFGCSEVGSMACRRSAREQDWQLFRGLRFIAAADSSQSHESGDRIINCQVQGDHLPGPVTLQDQVELHADNRFRLLGRNEDLLEIGGKRGSLQEINHILLTTPGVIDGVVFMAEPVSDSAAARPVALVALDKAATDKQKVLARLRQFLDPVFLPRPLIVVDALPREENGKLRRARLLEFWWERRR